MHIDTLKRVSELLMHREALKQMACTYAAEVDPAEDRVAMEGWKELLRRNKEELESYGIWGEF